MKQAIINKTSLAIAQIAVSLLKVRVNSTHFKENLLHRKLPPLAMTQ